MPRRTQEHQKAASDLAFEKGLPVALEAEKFVLGSILLNDSVYDQVAESLEPEDFSREALRRIYARMHDLKARGEQIDRLTVYYELQKQGQAESVGGLSALATLDEGMPESANLEAYIRAVKDKATLRKTIFAAQKIINRCLVAEDEPKDILSDAGAKLAALQSGIETEKEDGQTVEDVVTSFPGGMSAFLDPTLRHRGLSTGFRKLDEILGGGLQNGELIILAARPSMGKSALALDIAQHVAMHTQEPKRVDFFSLEMSAESLVTRALCAAARIDAQKFRSGFLNSSERGAIQRALLKITESPLRIHVDFKKSLSGLLRRVDRAIKAGSALVVFDYIQLMVTGGRTENRNLEIGEIGRALKTKAHDSQVPFLVLSQIGRSAEKRGGDMRPMMSDLKDSGTIEEHADTIGTIFREEVYKKDRTDIHGLADLDIIKQRAGPIGRVPLRFIHAWSSFTNRAEDTAFPEEQESEPPPPVMSYHEKEDAWD